MSDCYCDPNDGSKVCRHCWEPAGSKSDIDSLVSRHSVREVLTLMLDNRERWRDRDNNYWMARLTQEVGELASSLIGDHDDPPEHELRQIASIALNWLDWRWSD